MTDVKLINRLKDCLSIEEVVLMVNQYNRSIRNAYTIEYAMDASSANDEDCCVENVMAHVDLLIEAGVRVDREDIEPQLQKLMAELF